MLIYCDSCILIYCFDYIGEWNERTTAYLASMESRGDVIAVSDLV